jgi:hypothetical protein
MKNKILSIVVKHFNIKGFMSEMITEVLDEALDNVVKGTKNPMDDMAKAALWPVLEEEAKKLIEEKLDLAKIFKLEE